MHLSQSTLIVLFSALVHARTDLTGCTRTDVSSPAGASYAWIVPETGELCDPLDCGGGRAPPKTTVPGCALYVGTETYKPSFLAGFSASMTAGGVGSVEASATTTAAPTLTASTSAAATATAGTDDDADADDGDTDVDEDIYDLSDTYPTGWNDMTPQQKSSWVLSYWTVDPTEPITAMASATSPGASTSAQQSTTTPSVISASSAASSTPNLAVSNANSTVSSTTTMRDLPTLATASITSTMTTTSLSMSRSWVKTIPTFAKGAADVEIDRASVSSSGSAAKSSASASLVDSTGAAGKVGCAVGAAGVVAAVVGALAVL